MSWHVHLFFNFECETNFSLQYTLSYICLLYASISNLFKQYTLRFLPDFYAPCFMLALLPSVFSCFPAPKSPLSCFLYLSYLFLCSCVPVFLCTFTCSCVSGSVFRPVSNPQPPLLLLAPFPFLPHWTDFLVWTFYCLLCIAVSAGLLTIACPITTSCLVCVLLAGYRTWTVWLCEWIYLFCHSWVRALFRLPVCDS